MNALKRYRRQFCNEVLPASVLEEVYDKIGGRLSFLNRIAKAANIQDACNEICRAEKSWFLNKCWILGMEMDDDVMDEQKFSVSFGLLRLSALSNLIEFGTLITVTSLPPWCSLRLWST